MQLLGGSVIPACQWSDGRIVNIERWAPTLSDVVAPSLQIAAIAATQVRGNRAALVACLAPIWALLASVDTSWGPFLGPTSHSVFRDV